jgi:very-short-patch-repair endonuclease
LASVLEGEFAALWVALYPMIDLYSEYRFHAQRRWRFDFAHPGAKVAIEINGGQWIKSGHSSGFGLERDYTKLNAAMSDGWSVYQLSGGMIDEANLVAIAALIQEKTIKDI